MDNFVFEKARPIFLEALSKDFNIQAGIRYDMTFEHTANTVIYIAARSIYRLYINGIFVMHGPARAAHGYTRVDEIDISDYIKNGLNSFAFELISYGDHFNHYSNDQTLEPGMLICECKCEGSLVFASDQSWRTVLLSQRRKYSEKLSHCRECAELYDLNEAYSSWRTAPLSDPSFSSACLLDEDAVFIKRGMPYPDIRREDNYSLTRFGSASMSEKPAPKTFMESFVPDLYAKITEKPLDEYAQTEDKAFSGKLSYIDGGFLLEPKNLISYINLDFNESYVGFTAFCVECESDGIIDIIPSEIQNLFGDIPHSGYYNFVTRIHIKAGKTEFMAMEPSLMRYLKIYFRGTGSVKITNIHIMTYYAKDTKKGTFRCSDDDINRLYNASRKTLFLNTLDVFMDCPSRERGGWLCDSLWTARACASMTGDLSYEREFIENFLLRKAEDMWLGFFPDVYPANKSDFKNSYVIVTWSFWLAIEFCEYIHRSGDMEFANKYEKRFDALVSGALTFKGKSGLLENIPCLFIDWSTANNTEHLQPISCAANSLFAYTLSSLGKLYGNQKYIAEANNMKAILKHALIPFADSEKTFLCDALNFDGNNLSQTTHYSEAANYTMLWSELFDIDEVPELELEVIEKMGSIPSFEPHPNVGRAGMFVGRIIRLDMLAKRGEFKRLLDELRAMYYPQLKEGPGTLWENPVITTSSRCHGLNAHAGVHLTRDILGLDVPDELHKFIEIKPNPCGLRWASGTFETDNGIISLYWTMNKRKFKLFATVPSIYEVRLTLPAEVSALGEGNVEIEIYHS